MTRILGAGGASVFVAALLLLVGGSSEALAQEADFSGGSTPLIEIAVPQLSQGEPLMLVAGSAAGPHQPAHAADRVDLRSLVAASRDETPLDEEKNCLATAVYFEAKGESLEGQLAVANVVLNRTASGRYPASVCAVVKQKAQFSFVVRGRFPPIDPGCLSWGRAKAIARVATQFNLMALPSDVLWYHADYVAPSWRRGLKRVEKIGAHIFYRA